MSFYDENNPEQRELFNKNIKTPFLQEVFEQNTFSPFTRTDPSGIIYAIENNLENKGETTLIPMMRYTDVTEVYDDITLEGKGVENKPVHEKITVGKMRYAVKASDIDMAEIQVSMKLKPQLQIDLHNMGKIYETRRIVNQFARCFIPQNQMNDHITYTYYLRNNQIESDFNRIVLPKMFDATVNKDENSVSDDRAVFGNDKMKPIPEGSLGDQLDKLTINNPKLATSDNMSVKHIRKLISLANMGGRKPNSEQIVMPYKTSSKNGFNNRNYVLFVSDGVAAKLVEDPQWIAQSQRGIIENANQPSVFNNSYYLGSILNVDVVVITEFGHISATNTGNFNIGYAALCGKSAIGYAIGKKPKFTKVYNDHEDKYEVGFSSISGIRPLKFLSKSPLKNKDKIRVERGIIHSFTLID